MKQRKIYPINMLEDIFKGQSDEQKELAIQNCVIDNGISYHFFACLQFIGNVERIPSIMSNDIIYLYYNKRLPNGEIAKKYTNEKCYFNYKNSIISKLRKHKDIFLMTADEFSEYKQYQQLKPKLFAALKVNYPTFRSLEEALMSNPEKVWRIKKVGAKDIIQILDIVKKYRDYPDNDIDLPKPLLDKLKEHGCWKRYDLYLLASKDLFQLVDGKAALTRQELNTVVLYILNKFNEKTGKQFVFGILNVSFAINSTKNSL